MKDMSEEMMDDFTRLEALLLTTPYDELSAREQSWVEEQGLTPTDFEQQRTALLHSKEMLQADVLMPLPALKARLLRHQQAYYHPYASRRWILAASAAACAVLVFWLGRWSVDTSPTIVEKVVLSEPLVETVRDTIYLDKVVEQRPSPRIIYRDKLIRDTVYLMPYAASNLPAGQPEVLPITDAQAGAVLSRSAKDTESLLKILVEVY